MKPSSKRSSKHKDGTSSATLHAREATASLFERLPSELHLRVVQFLPLQDAFRARRVSRALRDAVEGATFDGGKLGVLCRAEEQWGVALSRLEQLVRDGRLKGGDLSVSVECAEELSSCSIRLLAALAGRCRSVRVKFLFSDSAEQLFRRHVADVLGALAPGGAPGPLQELELLSTVYQRGELSTSGRWDHLRRALEIPEERLAPIAGLRALRLPPNVCPSVASAAAIAARLPALRCLQLCCGAMCLARIVPLRLERIVLYPRDSRAMDVLRLSVLPSTPLGDSLRELRFEPRAKNGPVPFLLHEADLSALAHLPQLERVVGYPSIRTGRPAITQLTIGRLLRAPRLAAVQLALGEPLTLTALAAALAAAPPPTVQTLDLRAEAAAVPPALAAALLASPRLERLALHATEACVAGAGLARLAAGLAPLAALPPRPGPSGAKLRLELLVHIRQRERARALAARARGALASALPAAPVDARVFFLEI
eukprot:tig00001384_g8561.t1